MKLYYGALSPFVRKVMVLAHEKNILDRLERVPSPLTPVEPNADLMRANPLGKIPALTLDDGTVLFDSPVICEYLDTLGSQPKLFPAAGAERWRALCLNALADGLLDAAMAARVEAALRPAEKQWDKWSEVQLQKVRNALDSLNGAYAPSAQALTIGEIAVGCALGWLDFRMPQLEWRKGREQLAAWYETFSARPSMSSTAPKAS
jgi:glutathione S-transferase